MKRAGGTLYCYESMSLAIHPAERITDDTLIATLHRLGERVRAAYFRPKEDPS